MVRIELGDFLLIAEIHSGIDAHQLARIPRVINLLCEHCLVSGFVDQKKVIPAEVVDSVARDFDLADGNAAAAMMAPAPVPSDKFDLVEALRTLATLADRLRQSEQQDLPKEGKI